MDCRTERRIGSADVVVVALVAAGAPVGTRASQLQKVETHVRGTPLPEGWRWW